HPPLPILPVGPEIPVPREQQLGDVGRRRDDRQGRDPEDQVPLVVEEAVLLVQQGAELCCFLGRAWYSHRSSLLENGAWRNRRPLSTGGAGAARRGSLFSSTAPR